MNQDLPIKIFHFHNGTGGGVLSVIRNLLAFRQSSNIENHVIYTINKEKIPDYSVNNLQGATSERVFYYSSKWNFYYTCRELALLLTDSKSVIVAHDWIELGMISNLGLNNPVIHVLHGDYDYYFHLAQRHEAWIDSFICVSKSIAYNLKKRMPNRNNDIRYIPLPVPEINCIRENKSTLDLLFAGRCDQAKGYYLLPLIDASLRQKGIHANWHIAGPGSDQTKSQQQWENSKVQFYGNLSSEGLTSLLLKTTALVLPTLAEGMPVSVIEAMKAGVIPVVNDLKGGLQELVINNVTGYRIPNNEPLIFAECIEGINADIEKRKQISTAAITFANRYFNPEQNTKLFENGFLQAYGKPKKKRAIKTIGSRLDQPYFPNSIVNIIRNLYQLFK
jgi:glycosyltransferase involved in cell wall biosynthesis